MGHVSVIHGPLCLELVQWHMTVVPVIVRGEQLWHDRICLPNFNKHFGNSLERVSSALVSRENSSPSRSYSLSYMEPTSLYVCLYAYLFIGCET